MHIANIYGESIVGEEIEYLDQLTVTNTWFTKTRSIGIVSENQAVQE